MNLLDTHSRETAGQKPAVAEIAVEQLTVYRYFINMTDGINDPEAIALARFKASEAPDAGPAEGEQHELTTYFIGEAEVS